MNIEEQKKLLAMKSTTRRQLRKDDRPWEGRLWENCQFHAVYVALAIGCGSKPLPWMNDSDFWIVSRMSGMNETETLKTFSGMLSSMGVIDFIVVWLTSLLQPMV